MSLGLSRRNPWHMRKILVITGLSVALLATPAQAEPDRRAGPGPAWGACPATGVALDPRQECATLRVPLDYRRPRGEQISLAVSRISTARPGMRRGVLLLIPGGPGGAGLAR